MVLKTYSSKKILKARIYMHAMYAMKGLKIITILRNIYKKITTQSYYK